MSLKVKMTEWEAKKFIEGKNDLRPILHQVKFDTDKLTLALIGDEHLGSRYCKEDDLKYILDWCLKKGIYVIGMGDHIEAATRNSVGAGIYEQNEIIDQQIEHMVENYKPLADEGLLLGIHRGNHEARVWQSSGVDITKFMAKQLGVQSFGIGKLHKLKVGRETYMLYTTHGSSGARMPHTKIQACLRLSDMVEAEIYAHAHLHQLSHHVRNYYRKNVKKGTVEEGQKHFLLTGSYLSHWGSYAHQANLEPARIGSPKIKLHGDKHQIRVSLG